MNNTKQDTYKKQKNNKYKKTNKKMCFFWFFNIEQQHIEKAGVRGFGRDRKV